jgi:uncharacterized protein
MADPMPTVSSLFVYPIKSCRGVSLQQMQFDEYGPRWDRRWMLVDDEGVFVTQRTQARLAQIETRINGDELWVSAPGFEPLLLPSVTDERRQVKVWDFEGEALDQGDIAASWFQHVLHSSCRLVRITQDTQRRSSTRYTEHSSRLAFADGYPALLTSLESLAELNRRLEQKLPMNRFRPNIVVRECLPFEEDEWLELSAPQLRLWVVKPCVRCVITTIDQQTLAQGKEPLRTLAQFRRGAGFETLSPEEKGVTFGQNCVHHSAGTLSVGDVFVVEARRAQPESSLSPST